MTSKHKEMIERSHKRSKKLGADQQKANKVHKASQSDFKQKLQESQELIQVSEHFISELLAGLGLSEHYIVTLSDSQGCILKVYGHEKAMKDADKLDLSPGAFLDEGTTGTNAIGTAIAENRPVQINATEHFSKRFHHLCCSASPIHDSEDNILGTINLTADEEFIYPHTLGLIVAAANAIEDKMINSQIQKQLYDAHQFAFNIMNHLSFGLIAIDLDDKIRWVNDTACRSIVIRRSYLINSPIARIYPEWKKLKKRISKNERIMDEEIRFDVQGLNETYLANAYSIESESKEILGYALSFRPMSRMIQLINKYSGVNPHYTLENIVGNSPLMQQTKHFAKTVANTPSTVLLTGESGTGKEVFAQAIHNASSRKNYGFIAINCGAISESLIESELFGYEEAAFTGARKGGRPGKFELANGGTLFLDEIGEMPMDMQVKLLRALQEKSIMRVGGEKVIKVDVRIIAATNKNLEEEVKEGRFRQDLFYRLNVVHIELPPLRDMPDDIPLFINHIIKRKAAKLERPVPELSEKLLNELCNYKWPGNIRELENVMEKAVLFEGNISISGQPIFPSADNKEQGKTVHPENFRRLISLEETEKMAIQRTLADLEYNISKTATTLGIGRNTLYQKIKKHQIELP